MVGNIRNERDAVIAMTPFCGAIRSKERYGFMLYSIEITNGQQTWTIHRRYADFARLNAKLKKLFSHIRLKLPPKRIIRNFDPVFLNKRQAGLEEFMRKLFSLPEAVESDVVKNFFRLDCPPEYNENVVIETSFDGLQARHSKLEEKFTAIQLELDEVASAAEIALNNLGKLKITTGGTVTELTAPDIVRKKTESLRNSLDKAKLLRKEYLELHTNEVEELTSRLRSSGAAVSQMVYQYESELADMSHVKSTEQKYLFSLLLGVQLSKGLSGRPTECVNLKELHAMFRQIKREKIAIEAWPTWVQENIQNLVES